MYAVPPHCMPQTSAILSPCPAVWFPIKDIWPLNSPKTLFFKYTQCDKLVYNDT